MLKKKNGKEETHRYLFKINKGPLFIVRRTKTPKRAIIILNKASMENFVLYIKNILIKQSMPYIMIKNISNEVINGFWFYNTIDAVKFIEKIEDK
jgi:hypothetical protein